MNVAHPPAGTAELPVEVRIILCGPVCCAESVVPTLMGAVMAGLAENDTIADSVMASSADWFEMMSLCTFAILVFRAP